MRSPHKTDVFNLTIGDILSCIIDPLYAKYLQTNLAANRRRTYALHIKQTPILIQSIQGDRELKRSRNFYAQKYQRKTYLYRREKDL